MGLLYDRPWGNKNQTPCKWHILYGRRTPHAAVNSWCRLLSFLLWVYARDFMLLLLSSGISYIWDPCAVDNSDGLREGSCREGNYTDYMCSQDRYTCGCSNSVHCASQWHSSCYLTRLWSYNTDVLLDYCVMLYLRLIPWCC